jgi:hypothetical protein
MPPLVNLLWSECGHGGAAHAFPKDVGGRPAIDVAVWTDDSCREPFDGERPGLDKRRHLLERERG